MLCGTLQGEVIPRGCAYLIAFDTGTDQRENRDNAREPWRSVTGPGVLRIGSVTQAPVLCIAWVVLLGQSSDTDDIMFTTPIVCIASQRETNLSAKNISEDPRLVGIATELAASKPVVETVMDEIQPFILLETDVRGKLDVNNATDAFPCTPLQEGLMALSVKQPGSHIAKHFYKLAEGIDEQRFRRAWEGSVDACDTLRTEIVSVDGKAIQVVKEKGSSWEETKGMTLEDFTCLTKGYKMTYGSRLSRHAIVTHDDELYFVWVIHQSITDDWSLRIIEKTFQNLYWGLDAPVIAPFNRFVQYVQSLDTVAASTYWLGELEGSLALSFPPARCAETDATSHFHERTIYLGMPTDDHITRDTILRAAWSILLARRNGTSDVIFGATVAGRSAPVTGLQEMVGPAIATVPVRLSVWDGCTVSSFLQGVQQQASIMAPHEQFGLQNIAQLSQSAREACEFSSLLIIQPLQSFDQTEEEREPVVTCGEEEHDRAKREMSSYFNYPLVLSMSVHHDRVEVRFFYSSSVLTEIQVKTLGRQLEHVVCQLVADRGAYLETVSLISDWDVAHALQASRLTAKPPSCVHWLIENRILKQPDAPAVVSQDGNLTYLQLGLHASKLAAHIQTLGVKPEVMIPFCFPKSTWAIVSMLAIQMAGAAFVPLDPSAPIERLKSIIDDTEAPLVLASPSCAENLEALGTQIVSVDEAYVRTLPELTAAIESKVRPHNASFVIFSSGSIGKPKGIIHEHRAVVASAMGFGMTPRWSPSDRVFQFCVYTYDMGILDVLVGLIHGACICSPTNDERRNDLIGAINRTQANIISLTPTAAGLIDPERVPSVKRLLLSGEAITKNLLRRWASHVQIHGYYGPAEASVCAWRADMQLLQGSAANIGVPLNSAFWVVEPGDPYQLVPIGGVGELLIQGSSLARGYLDTDKGSNAGWLEDIDWLPGGGKPTRAYRTGDLVRRNEDGTFEYLGRTDSQIKYHSQRIELGEIEGQIQKALPGNMDAMVDIILDRKTQEYNLAAILWYGSGSESDKDTVQLVQDVTDEMRSLIYRLDAFLDQKLPFYMVPSFFLIFEGTPDQTASGKVNRRKLKGLASDAPALSKAAFRINALENTEPPSTVLELQLRDLWARALDIEPDLISRNSHFFRIGGDSIAAVRLVAMAGEEGLIMDVMTIFTHPRLLAIACILSETSPPSGNPGSATLTN